MKINTVLISGCVFFVLNLGGCGDTDTEADLDNMIEQPLVYKLSVGTLNFPPGVDSVIFGMTSDTQDLSFTATPEAPWLTISKTEGELSNGYTDFAVSIDRSSLEGGQNHESRILFSTGVQMVYLPISVYADGAANPFSLQENFGRLTAFYPEQCILEQSDLRCSLTFTAPQTIVSDLFTKWITFYSGGETNITGVVIDGNKYPGTIATFNDAEGESVFGEVAEDTNYRAEFKFTGIPENVNELDSISIEYSQQVLSNTDGNTYTDPADFLRESVTWKNAYVSDTEFKGTTD